MTLKNYIMVTGASSGVGKACVQLLKNKGYQVIAVFRNKNDFTALDSENIHPVIIELEEQQSIDVAVSTVSKITGNTGLSGLINCAGTIFAGPIEYFPRTNWQIQYNINLIGTMSLTAAMLSQIRKQNGRIVNIGAVGGGIALPFFGAIASAKIPRQVE
jgi:NAD(P)-dependent dehydrogenase (short-subunit alcohol dehydrogenase family)